MKPNLRLFIAGHAASISLGIGNFALFPWLVHRLYFFAPPVVLAVIALHLLAIALPLAYFAAIKLDGALPSRIGAAVAAFAGLALTCWAAYIEATRVVSPGGF